MNRREFLKGLTLASLFCLGTKKPKDYIPFKDEYTPQELDTCQPEDIDDVYTEDAFDYEITEWIHGSVYFWDGISSDCSNCNRYFCGPACKQWWKRNYHEPDAPYNRDLMPFRDSYLEEVGQEAFQTAKQHWNEKYREHNAPLDECYET